MNYNHSDPPEIVFISIRNQTTNESQILKYDLDRIVQTLEQEAELEKTVSINLIPIVAL